MKKTIVIILIILTVLTMSACSGAKKESASESQPTEAEHIEPADGYAELGGLWEVGAIKYNNRIIDIQDVPGLADLYDTTYLLFNEDGTFLYINIFFTSGTYNRLNSGDFLLKPERVYRMVVKDGTVVEEESTSGEKSSYLVTLIKDDPNSLQFSGYDSITGKAKAGDDPLYFVKSNQKSIFIDNHKYDIADLSSGKNQVAEQTTTFEEYTPTSATSFYGATTGEKNAVQRAKDYIDYGAFSYSGLIDQLKYEGFTASEAQYGADYCGADWFEQAERRAQEYLEYSSFSKEELIGQLEYDGFTSEQAVYGANQVY